METGDICKLRLENIAPGGEALGRFEGKPVFTEGGAPDETVLVRIVQEKKTWARAQVIEIIEPSPYRVDPVCAYYRKCTGCNLQHINYESQLDAKLSILKESFLKIGGFDSPQIETVSYNDAGKPLEYRNRMQFHCMRDNSSGINDLRFGQMGRSEIIAVCDCPVADKGIRKLLKEGGKITLPPEKDRFNVFAKDSVFLSEGGVNRGKIKLLDKEIMIDAGVFFQSNCYMLEKLILQLQNIAKDADKNLPMADLYCGVGTFAFFLGEMFPALILAEENKTAVSIARENLKGMKNARFFALKDTDWHKTFLNKKGGIGFAVVDPPRAGLNRLLAQSLVQNGPSHLAYVSCDAASLARDSKILAGGYTLKKIIFFDFYPQTAHIESLAVFEKNL